MCIGQWCPIQYAIFAVQMSIISLLTIFKNDVVLITSNARLTPTYMSICAPALAEHWVIGTSHQFIRRIELWTWTWTTAPGDLALPVQFDLIAFITCHADSILHNHHILNFWPMVKCHPSSILNVNLYLIHDTCIDMMLFSRIYCQLNSEKF